MDKTDNITPADLLARAAYHGDVTLVSKLIEEGVDLNINDQWGRTPLTLSAEQGHLEIVQLLLQGGAWVDPHDDNDTYDTPLIAAARAGRLSIVQTLISAGANPLLHGGRGQVPAEFYARTRGHREVSEYLRKVMEARLRASPNREENEG